MVVFQGSFISATARLCRFVSTTYKGCASLVYLKNGQSSRLLATTRPLNKSRRSLPVSHQRMTNACRLLADHIQRLELDEPLYEELKFLRAEFIDMLLEDGNQEGLDYDFRSQQELEVQNPWLRELTERYFG